MENFKSITNVKLNKSVVTTLKKEFNNWSAFSVGKTRTHVTPNGGIHYTGKLTETNCISFEIKRGGTYIMISLFEYPKGVVFHAHIFYPDVDKRSKDGWTNVLVPIYESIKTILEDKGK